MKVYVQSLIRTTLFGGYYIKGDILKFLDQIKPFPVLILVKGNIPTDFFVDYCFKTTI